MPVVTPATEPIHGVLHDPRPLSVSIVAPSSAERRLFDGLLAGYHYLGHRNTVGENLRYLLRDRMEWPVAYALFGSAAWKCADRDAYIGWDRLTRERNLQRLTNNTRFLIPPWVASPASGQPCSGPDRPPDWGRLANQVRTSRVCVGDIRGP